MDDVHHAKFVAVGDNFMKTVMQGTNKPTLKYEMLKRRISRSVNELWSYMSAQLETKTDEEKNERILQNAGDQIRSIEADLSMLSQKDGFDGWREIESKKLKDLVQRRLNYIQNPESCSQRKKILCKANVRGCGFGCLLHHLAGCMIIAYAMNRTLILEDTIGAYNNVGWETVFQPLSKSCTSIGKKENVTKWQDPSTSDVIQKAQVIFIPQSNLLTPPPAFGPSAIPADLSERLMLLHGDPFAWWMGQILTYIMRPQKNVTEILKKAESRLKFHSPIVGIQVRRTDKLIRAAAYHGIEEYMIHAEHFFRTLQLTRTITSKRIYLATDDISVVKEARKLYQDYEFVNDVNISVMAAPSERKNGLLGIIQDIVFLSHCDFLVCTMSSNICRIVYELMQTIHLDASSLFRSLDCVYFGHGQADTQKAIYSHTPQNSNEMELKPGDLVLINRHSNKWNGYTSGINRTVDPNRRVVTKRGLYPSYKVDNQIKTANMPLYGEADIQ